jgi:uncharacterized protein YecE (DUF72 family)
MSLPLFDQQPEAPPNPRLAARLHELAGEGIYFGTSSWKYEGWLGQIYTAERYMARGKFSHRKFEAECLAEYARTFPAVCGDFSFYQFPSPDYWRRLFGETPASLLFAFKVPEEITVATWPGHARYGKRAGLANASFLDVRLFETAFVRLLDTYRARLATLIFEFGTFSKQVFATPADFLRRLDPFLAALPGGFRYAVEIRNPEYLGPKYFDVLARHNVAHAFNAWTRMPEIGDQMNRPGSFTAEFTVVRALLRRGRGYADAVDTFQPYREVQQPCPPVRDALGKLVDHSRSAHRPAFLFINNRLEGNAPGTIAAVVCPESA